MTWGTALLMAWSCALGVLGASIVWNEHSRRGWRKCRRELEANHRRFMGEMSRISEQIERHKEGHER